MRIRSSISLAAATRKRIRRRTPIRFLKIVAPINWRSRQPTPVPVGQSKAGARPRLMCSMCLLPQRISTNGTRRRDSRCLRSRRRSRLLCLAWPKPSRTGRLR